VTTSESESVNEVLLSGRVSGQPQRRVLPSGDSMVSLRIVVPRPARRRKPLRGAQVDTLDCVAWLARPRGVLESLRPADRVQVRGSLRRRFWRGEHGPMSKVEIEVLHARRLRTGGDRAAGDPSG
jgi:single-strand DNA-binding protein